MTTLPANDREFVEYLAGLTLADPIPGEGMLRTVQRAVELGVMDEPHPQDDIGDVFARMVDGAQRWLL